MNQIKSKLHLGMSQVILLLKTMTALEDLQLYNLLATDEIQSFKFSVEALL